MHKIIIYVATSEINATLSLICWMFVFRVQILRAYLNNTPVSGNNFDSLCWSASIRHFPHRHKSRDIFLSLAWGRIFGVLRDDVGAQLDNRRWR